MPWRTQTIMDERARFVLEAQNSFLSHAELCRRYGISRPTGYKWLRRDEAGGLEGLRDRSHRPASCPHVTPQPIVDRILDVRKRRGWGARKLRGVIEREFGYAPSADTIHRILDRYDLLKRKKPRRRRTHPGRPVVPMDRPNATWSADFKGQFRVLDGQLYYPLTSRTATPGSSSTSGPSRHPRSSSRSHASDGSSEPTGFPTASSPTTAPRSPPTPSAASPSSPSTSSPSASRPNSSSPPSPIRTAATSACTGP